MSDNDKYKKVRGMLDSLNYIGTLHPDSVSLVDTILRDLIKLMGRHN